MLVGQVSFMTERLSGLNGIGLLGGSCKGLCELCFFVWYNYFISAREASLVINAEREKERERERTVELVMIFSYFSCDQRRWSARLRPPTRSPIVRLPSLQASIACPHNPKVR